MDTLIGKDEYLDLACQILADGGLVAFPTETVYGLGADAFNERAVAKIYEVKGRPKDNPFIVHIADMKDLPCVAEDVPDLAYSLFEKFSPGPLTLVLKKKKTMPSITTGGLDTVGVRIPNHQLALKLIKKSKRFIAAPSANISGRVSPTKTGHVYDDLNKKIQLILDGGDAVVGIESTVLDLTSDVPTILRPGAITAKMLSEVISKVDVNKGDISIAKAPGMKYTHYSPTCLTVGVTAPSHACHVYDMHHDKRAVIIGLDDFVAECQNKTTFDLGHNETQAMNRLFSLLRQCEKCFDVIILQCFDQFDARFSSINNRILKAIHVFYK